MEELKTVLEIIGRMSGDAANLGTWWIVMHYGVRVLTIIAFCTAIPVCIYLVTKAIGRYTVAERTLSEIAEIVGINNFRSWYSPDVRRIIDKVREALK